MAVISNVLFWIVHIQEGGLFFFFFLGRWSYTEHGFVTAFIADRTQLSSHALNVVVHYLEGIIAVLAGVLFLTCWGTPPWVVCGCMSPCY